MMEPVLEVKSLNVRFIDENGGLFSAVFNSSFAVNQGEVLAIVGKSGSGKSVTALSLLGLINPKKVLYKSTNSILFEGRELTSLSENEWQDIRGNEIGMVFQEPMSSLNPLMKVGEQVAEVIRVHKRVSEKKARARARYLLRLVGIDHADERMEAYPFELSGGQRQRVMIAMAVANHPKVLIADEPTTALDVTVQKQILELILRLKEKFGMAVVFISHDLNVVKKIANRVLVMRQGVIVEQGSVGNIFNAPIHPYTKELLAAFHHTAPRQDFKSRKLMEERPYARRGHLHPCRPGTGSSSQLPRNIGLLSFVQYHLPAQQRTGRCTVCRSTRTLHRPHHRILPDRRHQPGGKTDCHFRIQCI